MSYSQPSGSNYPSSSLNESYNPNNEQEEFVTEDISRNYVVRPDQDEEKNEGLTVSETTSKSQKSVITYPTVPAYLRGPFPTTEKLMEVFWVHQKQRMNNYTTEDVRVRCGHMPLPMARVKKIMRIDEDVRSLMISGDAPIFLATAAELFIEEVTALAWNVVEESRRRTMQKSDIINALNRSDQFDFLIDLIPRTNQFRRQYGDQQTAEAVRNSMQAQQQQQQQQQQQHQQSQQQPQVQQTEATPHIVQVQGQNTQYVVSNQSSNATQSIYLESGETITLDEHGNPIGELPPGVQFIVQNQNEDGTPGTSREYQAMDNIRHQNVTYENMDFAETGNQTNTGNRPQYRILQLPNERKGEATFHNNFST